MSIWVLKDGQREGPYEEQDIRELIYEGTYTGDDPAIRGGQFDWSTLGQLLNREPLEEQAGEDEEAPEMAAPPPMPADGVATPVEAVALEGTMAALPAEGADGTPMKVQIVDFQMPFGSVLTLMFKWVLAWLLVMMVLGGVVAMVWTFVLLMIAAATRR